MKPKAFESTGRERWLPFKKPEASEWKTKTWIRERNIVESEYKQVELTCGHWVDAINLRYYKGKKIYDCVSCGANGHVISSFTK